MFKNCYNFWDNKRWQLTTTTDVENYPGFANVIQGPWLMEQMEQQALHAGVELIFNHIVHIDHTKTAIYIDCENNVQYSADTVII